MKKIKPKGRQSGYALLTVIVMTGVSLAIMASTMKWVFQSGLTTRRNNDYSETVVAAEAATEKVLSAIARDFQDSGEGVVYSRLHQYRGTVPTISDDSYWSNFKFSNGAGSESATYIERTAQTNYVSLTSQYQGLKGMVATYKLVSSAKNKKSNWETQAGVGQEVQLATIPIFQFAIFYTMDLEINPGPPMRITGRVHGNQTIFCQPQDDLDFLSDVTAAGTIIHNKAPGDPTVRTPGTISYFGDNDSGVSAMNLPIGTNNTPDAIHQIIEIPPPGEVTTSLMGKQRYYNKTDITIVVDNSGAVAKSGYLVNNRATTIPWSQVSKFLSTNIQFYSKRELKTVKALRIDVAIFKAWCATNSVIRPLINADISSIFIADNRSVTSSQQSGIQIINGQELPSLGLTIATPNPLYVKGHFNCPTTSHRGTTNTTATKPASFVADAITVLSTAWVDADSGEPLSDRKAADTTVNAAFLAGIVPTTSGKYSGGVENFPRFLEDWGGKKFTYNGSMVVLYKSKIATTPWGSADVYSPPDRHWTFDRNYEDPRKLPPLTPQVAAVIRGKWAAIRPNTVHF